MSGKTQLHAVAAVTDLLYCCSSRCGSFFLFSLYSLALWLAFCLSQQNGKELLHCQLYKPVQKRIHYPFLCFPDDTERYKWSGLQLSGETISCQTSTPGSVSEHFVSGHKSNDPLHQITFLVSSVTLQAQERKNELKICADTRDWMLRKEKRTSCCWWCLCIVWGKQWWSILWASYWCALLSRFDNGWYKRGRNEMSCLGAGEEIATLTMPIPRHRQTQSFCRKCKSKK